MSPRTRTILAVACGCALALAPGTVQSTLAAGPTQLRLGSSPRLPRGSTVLGQLAGITPMQITVALRPADPAALESFAAAVSTPGSSVYRRYITPSQFATRFGATDSEIAAVQASLRAHGLSTGPVSANHLSIPVTTTAAEVEHALSVSLRRVALPSGTHAIVNDTAPLLDASIAGVVQGVEGLSTLSAPHPLSHRATSAAVAHSVRHVVTAGPQPCGDASAAAPGQAAFTADQIASAYGFSGLYQAGDFGAGQTVAVYELEPYTPGDIATYQACYGTHASVSGVSVDGGAGGQQQGEAALDIEQVIGLAPAANVLVYEGPNSNSGAPGAGPYDVWNAIISQDRARVVTASWGQCEALEGGTNAGDEATLFQEAAAQGQTIVSASGDQGSEDCNNPPLHGNATLAVDDPSSQKFVTGVGGTTLTGLGPRPTEEVWNSGGGLAGLLGFQSGAGGGGLSSFWTMPSYQANAAAYLRVRQSGSRESPDVSADADPNSGYLIYWDGSWSGIGGTSGAAPLWAALVALANASGACSGSVVGFANPALYTAAGSAYAQDFNDVLTGNNDYAGTNGGRFTAGPGYDMASGLGTPNASGLVSSLCVHATQIGTPKVSGASLYGVRRARPQLQLIVRSGVNAPALRKLAVRLPSGLRFAGRGHRIVVTGPNRHGLGYKASISHGVLTVVLVSPKTRVKVTVSYATLTVSRSEQAAARQGRAGKLRIPITVADSRNRKTQLTAMVRPRS